MTKPEIKKEDYREITPYWCSRLLLYNGESMPQSFWEVYLEMNDCAIKDDCKFKQFTHNILTLGYPSANDTERILKLEHKGIEIRTGNPEWGAEPNKLYFVIKHGDQII